jgi:hypothetical protein
LALALRGTPATINSISAHRAGAPHCVSGRCRHTEVFDLEEFLDAVFRALAAEDALLHAVERRHLGRDDTFVDVDDAVFEPTTSNCGKWEAIQTLPLASLQRVVAWIWQIMRPIVFLLILL